MKPHSDLPALLACSTLLILATCSLLFMPIQFTFFVFMGPILFAMLFAAKRLFELHKKDTGSASVEFNPIAVQLAEIKVQKEKMKKLDMTDDELQQCELDIEQQRFRMNKLGITDETLDECERILKSKLSDDKEQEKMEILK